MEAAVRVAGQRRASLAATLPPVAAVVDTPLRAEAAVVATLPRGEGAAAIQLHVAAEEAEAAATVAAGAEAAVTTYNR